MIDFGKKILIQALDCGSDALIIVNARKPDLPVVYVNTAFEASTGVAASDVIGSGLTQLVTHGPLPEVIKAGQSDWLPDDSCTLVQSWGLRDGREIQLQLRLSPLYDKPGTPAFWLLTQVAATASRPNETALRDALHDARRRLKSLERTDPVTGAPNEAVFTEVLQRDWSIARRENRHLGLVVFRVDCFAEYINVFSRHAADSLMRKIGNAINGSLRRAGDFGARLGEDQFAVLIGNATDVQALAFAERVVEKVHRLAIHHPRSTKARFVTISHGCASEIPEWTAASSTLLEHAVARLVDDPTDVAPASAKEA